MKKIKLNDKVRIEHIDVQIIKNKVHIPIIVKKPVKTKVIRSHSSLYLHSSREIRKWFELREI